MIFLAINNNSDKLLVEHLYNEYKNLMFLQAHKILNNNFYAEDAVHQAFVRVIDNLHKIDRDNRPRTRNFLVIICENIAKNTLKNLAQLNRHEGFIYDIDSQPDDEFSNPIEFTVNNDTVEKIKNIIVNDLNPIYRDVILLKAYHNLNNKEIATLLEVSEETVKKRLYRGRKTLSEKLKREEL